MAKVIKDFDLMNAFGNFVFFKQDEIYDVTPCGGDCSKKELFHRYFVDITEGKKGDQ